jgi:hypothetical protein
MSDVRRRVEKFTSMFELNFLRIRKRKESRM